MADINVYNFRFYVFLSDGNDERMRLDDVALVFVVSSASCNYI